jgi:hypothetical protein
MPPKAAKAKEGAAPPKKKAKANPSPAAEGKEAKAKPEKAVKPTKATLKALGTIEKRIYEAALEHGQVCCLARCLPRPLS